LKKFILFKKWLASALENMADILCGVNPGIVVRLVFASFIALFFIAGVLQWSLSYGRLAHDITYDDVTYFNDAYTRIQVFYQQGLGPMIAGLLHNPPHSPWSSLLAFSGFAVFGPFDWVPYLMNGINIFLFLGFLTYILRNVHFAASAVLMVLVLFVPFSFIAVHDFRPDFAVGLFTCIFSFLAIESFLSGQNHDKLKLRCAGIVFGIALLSKPSFFAHTLALALFVSIYIILYQLLFDYRKWRQENGKTLLFVLRDFYLPGLVLAVPYYAFTWRHIWDYFWINTRGAKSEIWNFKENHWEVLKTFTVGDGGSLMISGYLYFFVGIVILSIILLLNKRKWRDLYILSGLLAVALFSLGIIVYGRMNNTFFGLTYQIMLCLAACYCLSAFYKNRAIFSLLLSAFILFSGWYVIESKSLLPILSANNSPLVRKENSVNMKIIRAINCYLKKNDLPSASGNVFVSFAGYANASCMKWLALQNSLSLDFSDLHTQNDMVAYKKVIAESDFVIVADDDADGIHRWLPSYALQKPVLDLLRSQPAMKEILIVQTKKYIENSAIRVFVNKSSLDKKSNTFDVSLPYSVQGFLPAEGPYPQWNLPVVRWGLSPESKIVLPDKLSGKINLDLSARGIPGARLIVMINAVQVYNHVFSGNSFENIRTSFSTGPGANVVKFQYEGINQGKDQNIRTVLFQNITFHPAGNDTEKIDERAVIISAADLFPKALCP
jgi:hypothetical protein